MSSENFANKSVTFGEMFGDLVHRKRREEGLTQQELAVRAFGDESKKSRISELENGKISNPGARIISELSAALDLTAADISFLRSEAAKNRSGRMSLYQRQYPVERIISKRQMRKIASEPIEGKLLHDAFARGFATDANLIRGLESLLCEFPAHDGFVSLCFIDVDGASLINNRHGHEALDRILREVEVILLENVPGHAIFRIGGDEYVFVLYSRRGVVDSEDVLFNILLEIESFPWEIKLGIEGLFVRARAGIAHAYTQTPRRDGLSLNFHAREWLTRAYLAMIHAKRHGTVFFIAPNSIESKHVVARQYDFWEYTSIGCIGEELCVSNVYNVFENHASKGERQWCPSGSLGSTRRNIVIDSEDDIHHEQRLSKDEFENANVNYKTGMKLEK